MDLSRTPQIYSGFQLDATNLISRVGCQLYATISLGLQLYATNSIGISVVVIQYFTKFIKISVVCHRFQGIFIILRHKCHWNAVVCRKFQLNFCWLVGLCQGAERQRRGRAEAPYGGFPTRCEPLSLPAHNACSRLNVRY